MENWHAMSDHSPIRLELEDIQSGALHERPSPYFGTYLLIRIDEPRAGRELVRRLLPVVDSSRSLAAPPGGAWVTVALTFQGLRALGVPADSLASFPPEFQQGMAARAHLLGDVGENAPEHWEAPLGSPDVHLAVAALSTTTERLEAALARARDRVSGIAGSRADLEAGLLPAPEWPQSLWVCRRHGAARRRRERPPRDQHLRGAAQGR